MTFQAAVELAAVMAMTTVVIVNPGNGQLSVDMFVDNAQRSMHVFVVLLAALIANTNIN